MYKLQRSILIKILLNKHKIIIFMSIIGMEKINKNSQILKYLKKSKMIIQLI